MVGKNGADVNLQFANDTIMFVEADPTGAANLKFVIHCFDLVTGFNVTWGKRRLSGIGLREEEGNSSAAFPGCHWRSCLSHS